MKNCIRWILTFVGLWLPSSASAQLTIHEEFGTINGNPVFHIREEVKAPIRKQQVWKDRYVVAFTATYCGPCRAWKNSTVPAEIESAGYQIVWIDSTNGNTWGVERVPEYWVADRATKAVLKKFKEHGKLTLRDVESVTKPVVIVSPPQRSVVVSVSNIYNGRPGNSHTNRQSLITHLLNDGIHRGKHNRSVLNTMTDQQLSDLHDVDHGNRH